MVVAPLRQIAHTTIIILTMLTQINLMLTITHMAALQMRTTLAQ
jgi:hypothetical protein